MWSITIGKLVVSNCKYKGDVMFFDRAAKHLFWCFWWCI